MTRRRLIALVAVWTLPSLLFVTTTCAVYRRFHIDQDAPLSAETRTQVTASLRAALDDHPELPCTSDAAIDGVVAVTVWSEGEPLVRVDGRAPRLGAAIDDAARQLRAEPKLHALALDRRTRARLQVDVITGRAPLAGGWLVKAISIPDVTGGQIVNPGVDGIAYEAAGQLIVALPHELVAGDVLISKSGFELEAGPGPGAAKPPSALPEFATGVDMSKLTKLLATRGGSLTAADELYRIHTDSFVEVPAALRPAAPLPLTRGNTPPPALSGRALREAALQGARYLVGQLGPNGRYTYELDLSTGKPPPTTGSSYSMPRHAGTTYFLAELYRITKEPWLREPIERAFAHLAELLATGRCATTLPDGSELDCVLDKNEATAQLGSTALTVVALAEYQRATGDERYLPLAKKLARFLLFMQRPDGSFRHRYDPRTKLPNETEQQLYYSGEASLALARMYAITHEPAYARGAEAGLDWLVAWYDFFMGGFLYGEEHWTCIAAQALYPTVDKASYREFCDGYGAYLRGQQALPDDLAGAYSVTAFVPPSNTPAGSRTEAMISAYLLGRAQGHPDDRLRTQIRAALQYLLGQQIRPDNDFAVVGAGQGAIPKNPIDRSVRIDYVQHVCSAMIRASEWIDGP